MVKFTASDTTGDDTLPGGLHRLELIQPTRITFGFDKPAVTIHRDGRVEVHEGFSPDDAAREFWRAVTSMAPEFFKSSRPPS